MTYTINPNAKDVWIRDNEDTTDLSPITDASSVYLENGRTLEQELGEGSMVSNVATVNESMSKVIDGTLDGAYESGVLKGKSLVNCVEQSMFKPMYTSRVETEGGFVYTQTEYQVATRLQFDYTQYSLLNNNTYYLISFELKVNKARILNITTDGTGYEGYGLQIEENTHTLIRQKIKFSPNGTVLRIYVRCKDGIDYTNDTFTLKNLMLIPYQEGMENWDIPYFEGICDVKMPILRNVGKNLFKSELELGTINADTGENMVFNARIRTKDFTLIKAEKTYSIKSHSVYWFNRLFFYDASKIYIGNTVVDGDEKVFTTPKDTKYMKVVFRTKTNTDMSVQDIHGILQGVQIEETSTPTSYEPYKTNILHTSEEIVLRSLPNGVCDTYNVITGEYVKRIGEVVLDGSEDENWRVESSSLSCLKFVSYVDDENRKVGGSLWCNAFNGVASGEHLNTTRIGIGGRVVINTDKASTSETFKQWLSQNPVTIQCELATPITTTADPIGVPFAYENGHVILESGYEGQSLLPTLEYSTVVNKTGQIQSVAKTIMKQETQITGLEKMLVQSIVEMDYNNTLLTLNLEIDEVM